MRKYTVVTVDRKTVWELHTGDCWALTRGQNRLRDQRSILAESSQSATEKWIDGELRGLDYSEHDVRVMPCCSE